MLYLSGKDNMSAPFAAPIAHLGADGAHHLLLDHLRDVAKLAGIFAAPWGGADEAYCAGIWHDVGKYKPEFQEYLAAHQRANAIDAHNEQDAAIGAPRKGSVDHSTAGAILAIDKFGPRGMPIALAIAGHHCGLKDCADVADRIRAKREHLQLARDAGIAPDVVEHTAALSTLKTTRADARLLEFRTRMLFSALVDADFLDTEEFFDRERTKLRSQTIDLGQLRARLAAYVDARQQSMAGRVGRAADVGEARRLVRADCNARAKTSATGLFTLTVPTGGGKTLAGMEFALEHALAWGLKRVIVAIPFTSIVEQTSQVYRDAFGIVDPDDTTVIEHHSAFDPLRETTRSKLATENWDAPIVVTTTVQLLESLFASRTSQCRKLHNLAESVIILDEAQTLPRGVLACTLEALESLSKECRTSIVLSTATQPALLRSVLGTPRAPELGLSRTTEISSSPKALFGQLKRVDVRWPADPEVVTTYDELADELVCEEDVMAIVHKRADARTLVERLDRLLGNAETMHLSALMLPMHRSKVIQTVKDRKAAGEPVRLVATQLVEAGVDLDFAIVYRALGGLDALAQAAGRCNREGKLPGLGQLRTFLAESSPPRGIATQALQTTQVMLRSDPNLDLFAPETSLEYFRRLYGAGDTDEFGIQALREKLAFEKIDAAYSIIDDGWSAAVVVPVEPVLRHIAELRAIGPSRRLLRVLGRYSVNVSKLDLASWTSSGFVEVVHETVHVLRTAQAYSTRFGLLIDKVATVNVEDLVT
jgi:CRISPR-associated endonuclease/helicase Cas3